MFASLMKHCRCLRCQTALCLAQILLRRLPTEAADGSAERTRGSSIDAADAEGLTPGQNGNGQAEEDGAAWMEQHAGSEG